MKRGLYLSKSCEKLAIGLCVLFLIATNTSFAQKFTRDADGEWHVATSSDGGDEEGVEMLEEWRAGVLSKNEDRKWGVGAKVAATVGAAGGVVLGAKHLYKWLFPGNAHGRRGNYQGGNNDLLLSEKQMRESRLARLQHFDNIAPRPALLPGEGSGMEMGTVAILPREREEMVVAAATVSQEEQNVVKRKKREFSRERSGTPPAIVAAAAAPAAADTAVSQEEEQETGLSEGIRRLTTQRRQIDEGVCRLEDEAIQIMVEIPINTPGRIESLMRCGLRKVYLLLKANEIEKIIKILTPNQLSETEKTEVEKKLLENLESLSSDLRNNRELLLVELAKLCIEKLSEVAEESGTAAGVRRGGSSADIENHPIYKTLQDVFAKADKSERDEIVERDNGIRDNWLQMMIKILANIYFQSA